jgi:NAD(P)-dependent dehydrogenase (short-subunit alcohol dehydrogenase family)
MGFESPIRALIIGGRGGIGAAFITHILSDSPTNVVMATHRPHGKAAAKPRQPGVGWLPLDLSDEASFTAAAMILRDTGQEFNCIINCTGLLHAEGLSPERSWRHLNMESMAQVFSVNTLAVAMAIKHFLPLMTRTERSVFASLSARVGSIEDNRLGGWYSYRASKAAQNMLLKCAAIEAKRLWPQLTCVALHPGTVDTHLSKPFTARTAPERLFSAKQSTDYLARVIADLTPSDSGGFFAWDGARIQF